MATDEMEGILEYPFDSALKNSEDSPSTEDDQAEQPPSDVVAYNELRSCADLKRMHDKRQLTLDPDFQREFVWSKANQTRFIDSLTKQLPIPSMCISYDSVTDDRIVIDGRQRISTILEFLSKDNYALSKLEDIDPAISGRSVLEIRTRNPRMFERVENYSIPVTVIRCNTKIKAHMDYLFTIFHRLNSGGLKLNNQEIRNCIYNGQFNSLLKELAESKIYLDLMGVETSRGYRFAFEEQILRYFAFSKGFENYKGKFAKFLSDFMFEQENSKNPATPEQIAGLRDMFMKTIAIAYEKVTAKTTLHGLSKAVIDALLVGISRNLEYLAGVSNEKSLQMFETLKSDPLFSPESLGEGIAQKQKVQDRLTRAIAIFSE